MDPIIVAHVQLVLMALALLVAQVTNHRTLKVILTHKNTIDFDECGVNRGGCNSTSYCVNTPGSFRCSPCPSGFESVANTCQGNINYYVVILINDFFSLDVNECLTNNGGCDYHVQCHNLIGNFSCDPCPFGYSGDSYTICDRMYFIDF